MLGPRVIETDKISNFSYIEKSKIKFARLEVEITWKLVCFSKKKQTWKLESSGKHGANKSTDLIYSKVTYDHDIIDFYL